MIFFLKLLIETIHMNIEENHVDTLSLQVSAETIHTCKISKVFCNCSDNIKQTCKYFGTTNSCIPYHSRNKISSFPDNYMRYINFEKGYYKTNYDIKDLPLSSILTIDSSKIKYDSYVIRFSKVKIFEDFLFACIDKFDSSIRVVEKNGVILSAQYESYKKIKVNGNIIQVENNDITIYAQHCETGTIFYQVLKDCVENGKVNIPNYYRSLIKVLDLPMISKKPYKKQHPTLNKTLEIFFKYRIFSWYEVSYKLRKIYSIDIKIPQHLICEDLKISLEGVVEFLTCDTFSYKLLDDKKDKIYSIIKINATNYNIAFKKISEDQCKIIVLSI